MVKVQHHTKIAHNVSSYNIVNDQGQYIQQLIKDSELESYLQSVEGKLVSQVQKTKLLPKSHHQQFYQNSIL